MSEYGEEGGRGCCIYKSYGPRFRVRGFSRRGWRRVIYYTINIAVVVLSRLFPGCIAIILSVAGVRYIIYEKNYSVHIPIYIYIHRNCIIYIRVIQYQNRLPSLPTDSRRPRRKRRLCRQWGGRERGGFIAKNFRKKAQQFVNRRRIIGTYHYIILYIPKSHYIIGK